MLIVWLLRYQDCLGVTSSAQQVEALEYCIADQGVGFGRIVCDVDPFLQRYGVVGSEYGNPLRVAELVYLVAE